MPLASLDVKRVDFPDEGDWYDLREEIGYFDHRIGLYGYVSVDEVLDSQGDPRHSIQKIMEEMSPVEHQTRQRLTKIKHRLIAWSHQEPLTWENIKRIPNHHAEKLLEVIETLEMASRPFRGQQGDQTSD